MISIIRENANISVSGHADYAPRGSDVVCAGVTALTQTLIESLEKLTDDRIATDFDFGHCTIKFIEEPSRAAKLLEDSFIIGVKLIATEFPEYVQVSEP